MEAIISSFQDSSSALFFKSDNTVSLRLLKGLRSGCIRPLKNQFGTTQKKLVPSIFGWHNLWTAPYQANSRMKSFPYTDGLTFLVVFFKMVFFKVVNILFGKLFQPSFKALVIMSLWSPIKLMLPIIHSQQNICYIWLCFWVYDFFLLLVKCLIELVKPCLCMALFCV